MVRGDGDIVINERTWCC